MEFLTREGEKVNVGCRPHLSPRINGELQVNQRSSEDGEITRAEGSREV